MVYWSLKYNDLRTKSIDFREIICGKVKSGYVLVAESERLNTRGNPGVEVAKIVVAIGVCRHFPQLIESSSFLGAPRGGTVAL